MIVVRCPKSISAVSLFLIFDCQLWQLSYCACVAATRLPAIRTSNILLMTIRKAHLLRKMLPPQLRHFVWHRGHQPVSRIPFPNLRYNYEKGCCSLLCMFSCPYPLVVIALTRKRNWQSSSRWQSWSKCALVPDGEVNRLGRNYHIPGNDEGHVTPWHVHLILRRILYMKPPLFPSIMSKNVSLLTWTSSPASLLLLYNTTLSVF